MCTTVATRNRQSIGMSSASMHSTAAQLQIYTQTVDFTPCFCTDVKKKVSKLKDKQHLVSSYHNKGQFSCKANATTLEKNKIKTLRGSEMVEKSEVSKLRISTYHLKVCKNTFHLYQYTGYISSAFSFYHICADWDTSALGLNGSP